MLVHEFRKSFPFESVTAFRTDKEADRASEVKSEPFARVKKMAGDKLP